MAASSPTSGYTSGYSKGLHELGDGCYAYLQPDGSWGWSNAGLITDGGESLLVDTLYDLKLTKEMLEAMRSATPAAAKIGAVVNTHANGDHCYGNQLVKDSPIIATKAAAEELLEVPPKKMADTVKMMKLLASLPWPLGAIPAGRGMASLKEVGQFFTDCFGPFDYQGIELTPPTETFSGTLTRKVGNREVRLIEVGPAHTRGDMLAYVPDARLVFTGDILFHKGHPILWAGPVANWLKACDTILELDVDVVVPGHGPLADKEAVRRLRAYLEYVSAEARKRFDAGMSVLEASLDIALGDFSSWGESERIVANVDMLYREFRGDAKFTSPPKLFVMMATVAREKRRR